MWSGVLPTLTKQFSTLTGGPTTQLNSELDPTGKGTALQDLPPPLLQMPITSMGYNVYFWPGYILKISTASPLGLTNLLELVTRTQRHICPIKHPFIMKGWELGKSQREIPRVRSGEGSLVNCTLVSQAPAGKWSHFPSHFTRQSHHRLLPNFKDDGNATQHMPRNSRHGSIWWLAPMTAMLRKSGLLFPFLDMAIQVEVECTSLSPWDSKGWTQVWELREFILQRAYLRLRVKGDRMN